MKSEETYNVRATDQHFLRKRVNSRERDAVPICNDIEPVRESRADVEIGNEEEE